MSPTPARVERRARDFYAVYCASADGKNYQGLPCPSWSDLTDAVRRHWTAVARRAMDLDGTIVIDSRGQEHDQPPDSKILDVDNIEHAVNVWRTYAGEPT